MTASDRPVDSPGLVVQDVADNPGLIARPAPPRPRAVADDRPPYVTPAEIAELLGVDVDDPRVARVCDAATVVVNGYYGRATVDARLPWPTDPPIDAADQVWPSVVREAALTIAADLWRRPSAPGGYFQVADYTGRLALDPANPVAVLLDSLGRLEWPIA